MSTFWSLWVIVLTVVSLALVTWLLFANRKVAVRDDDEPENRVTGHVYDGIEEYDNPLPRWWFLLFLGTLIYTVGYLIWYPGLGNFAGIGGWTSVNELEHDQGKVSAEQASMFGDYLATPVTELAQDNTAMKMGVRLFANNCSVCHGADGGGAFGFPNLTDKDWLYGGTPEAIKHTLINGRSGNMPGWGAIIGEPNVVAVAEYVLSLSGGEHDAVKAKQGAEVFQLNCAACHGANGAGNQAMGAPNLRDGIWLYAGDRVGIQQSVRAGRANVMPAQKDKLQEGKIHLLAAYVYSLSLEN